jgi:uncharacterized MnhB-related membrane protein
VTATSVVQVVLLVLVGAGGAAVALTRNPLHQAMVSGGFGTVLALLFLVVHAPDVALSEIVVGSFVIPTLVLVTLARAGTRRRDHTP